MKRYFMYLLFYSFGGYVLERLINLIAAEYWHDNSVLYGPIQPLYGIGVILLVIINEFYHHVQEESLFKDIDNIVTGEMNWTEFFSST